MFKLFKRIRLNYITENRFSKYLLYALGEIVLIVIGILIALSLDSWNNERNNRKREKLLLNEMLTELVSDQTHLMGKLSRSKEKLNSTLFLLSFMDEGKTYHDSINTILSKTQGWTSFLPSKSSFETLNNTGFSLLSDDSLKMNIQNLYNGTYTYIQEVEKWRSDFHFHERVPFQSRSYKKVDWFSESIPIDGQKLLNSTEFYYIISTQRTLANQEIAVYQNTISEIESLIIEIERDLDIQN